MYTKVNFEAHSRSLLKTMWSRGGATFFLTAAATFLPLPEYNHSSICKKTTTNNSKKKSWERAFDCCHIIAIVKANMRRRWSPCELSLATVSSKHSGPFSARLGALRGHVYGQSGPKQGSRGLHLAFSTLYKRFKLWHGDGIVHRKALPSVCLNGLKKNKSVSCVLFGLKLCMSFMWKCSGMWTANSRWIWLRMFCCFAYSGTWMFAKADIPAVAQIQRHYSTAVETGVQNIQNHSLIPGVIFMKMKI